MEVIKKYFNQLNVLTILVGILAMLTLAAVFSQGCATIGSGDLNKISYQILETSKSTYDLVTDSVNDLYKKKLITEVDYIKIEKQADMYMEAHNVAIDAVNAFKAGVMSAEQASSKVTAVAAALTELLRIAQPYILKLEKEV